MPGMISGNTPEPSKRFSGVVQSDNDPIEVMNGIALVDKVPYFVSDDGKYVVDKDQNLVAIIMDGKVREVTPEIADQLRQQGIVK